MKAKRVNIINDYQMFAPPKTTLYCRKCGQEIIWVDSPTGTSQSYEQYQQECEAQMHYECFVKMANDINRNRNPHIS